MPMYLPYAIYINYIYARNETTEHTINILCMHLKYLFDAEMCRIFALII